MDEYDDGDVDAVNDLAVEGATGENAYAGCKPRQTAIMKVYIIMVN